MIKCYLDGANCEALWDTGSMVSLVDVRWVRENFLQKRLHSIKDFLKNDNLQVKTANSTEILLDGVILMDFLLISGLPGFTVPFLVTSQEINELILGYNVIDQVILNEEQKANLPLCLSTCYDNGKAEAVISLIQERSKRPDLLETIKVPMTIKIDGGNTSQIKCKVKISMDTQKKTIHFIPEVNENGGDELIFVEAIVTLKRGRSQYIFIEVQNRTNKQIVLPKGKKMGTVHSVVEVIPMKMKNSEVNT